MLVYILAFIIFVWTIPACSNEQIDHTNFLVSDISNLYISNKFSDVILDVGGEKFHAHRAVLASRSKYFEILFFGGHKETYDDADVKIKDVPVALFNTILKYIYTGRLNLSDFEGREIFELLKTSDFFEISNLTNSLNNYLQRNIKKSDVCSFLTMTQLYQFRELEEESLKFIEINALEVLLQNDFLNLSTEALQKILNRDTFYANELVIFDAVCRWVDKNQDHLNRDTKIKVLSAVRYPLMSEEERSEAKESHLVSLDIVLDAIQYRDTWSSDKPQFRGQLKPDEFIQYESHSPPVTSVNLIHRSQGFSVLNNKVGTNLIKLNNPSIINYIEITLWKRYSVDRMSCYSYYIEVSIDGHHWERVIDHSDYNCRSIQRLWINPQIVRYIHFVGIKRFANATFKIENIRYDTKNMHALEIKNGLVAPKDFNVASEYFNNAIVIEGRNIVDYTSLLSGYYDDYSRYASYTYHLLGSGSIVIHLTQPYILSSMRMLLWGGNKQTYNYTVEVSLNNLIWDKIVDKSNEPARSWQVLQFIPTPTLYIRITGVKSSPKNDFRCVYLEAPAQVPLDSNDRADKRETDTTMIASSSENPVV